MPHRIFNINSVPRLSLAFENPEYTLSCMPSGFVTTFLGIDRAVMEREKQMAELEDTIPDSLAFLANPHQQF
jgi:hypothetical protein